MELDPKLAAIASAAFVRYGVSDRITLIEGPALETLPELSGQFDIIFIDANKCEYRQYMEIILDTGLLRASGLILADNGQPFYEID